ncbi:MAG: ABC transporter permease subunit [Virgibacillus proomii]|jgi:ABC-2 type transport system permease protein
MVTVLYREFINSFKSIRSILIILFLTFVSYQSANFLENNQDIINIFLEEGLDENTIYNVSISFIILLFGFLFVSTISHDLINSETEMNTIRLLVTKISRLEVMLGKLVGTLLFWIAIISISYAIVFALSGTWSMNKYLQTLVLLFYIICFVLLISTIITKAKLSMFLGIFSGISLPIIGLVATMSNEWYWMPFKYILPFNYLSKPFGYMFIPFAVGMTLFGISMLIIKRRDL